MTFTRKYSCSPKMMICGCYCVLKSSCSPAFATVWSMPSGHGNTEKIIFLLRDYSELCGASKSE
jgi:hypothetical protein